MKTLALFLCMFLVIVGFYFAIFGNKFIEGSIVMNLGGFCCLFLLIARKTKKIAGYNPNHWMNK